MNIDLLTNKIHQALNEELLKRLLIRYFNNKGYTEDFNQKIHPPTISDLPAAIPQLINKIEIEPHIINIFPQTGQITLGWNLFILGNQRIFLGESSHNNAAEIQQSIQGPLSQNNTPATKCTTPNKIIEFIIETLNNDKEGNITTIPQITTMPQPVPFSSSTGDQSGYFKKTNRPIY